MLLPQIYLGRDVIRGHLNCVGESRCDSDGTSSWVIILGKSAPLVSHVGVPFVMLTMAALRTTEHATGNNFATGIWRDGVLYLGLPIAYVACASILYALATADRDPKDNQKQV